MLTYNQFEHEIEKIKAVWGTRLWMPQICKATFEQVKSLDQPTLSTLIGRLLETGRMISPAVFMEAAGREAAEKSRIEAKWLLEQRTKEGRLCKWCENSGQISAEKRNEICQPFSFRCPYCDAAELLRVSPRIPTWSQEFSKDFITFAEKEYGKKTCCE